MDSLRYTPSGGEWLAIVVPNRLLFVPSATVTDAHALWRALGDGHQAALDILAGRGIAATPPFALLEAEGDAVRALVRGSIRVTLGGEGTIRHVEGEGVATWTEQVLTGVTSANVSDGGSADGRGERPDYPIEAGVVPAAGLHWSTAAVANDIEPDSEAFDDDPEATIIVDDSSDATVRMDLSALRAKTKAPELWGDHDGLTIVAEDLRELRATQGRIQPPPGLAPAAAAAYTLELSTGGRERLTAQPVIIGRAPTASATAGGVLPRIVTIPGDKDISRNHVRVTIEGDTVVVTDLHSRNGTQVVLPGAAPQQLRAGEPTSVIAGTVIDLGGGVTFTVRGEG